MKLSNPFGKAVYRINQTTHGSSASNPEDLAKQKAIDAGSTTDAVFAQADGLVKNVVTYPKAMWQSFIRMKYPGLRYPKLQVHVVPYKGIKSGVKVLRGQRIGTLHSTVIIDKKVIHSKHLHDAFEGAIAPNPFDYLDQSTKVTSLYPSILKTSWFKKGVFQWDKFKNLHYRGVVTTGRYELSQAHWIKKQPSTESNNYRKAAKSSVGKVLSKVVKQGGYEWQYISFSDVSGWIPNFVLRATVKAVTTYNLTPLKTAEDKIIEILVNDTLEVSVKPVEAIDTPTHELETATKELEVAKDDIEVIKKADAHKYSNLTLLFEDLKKRYNLTELLHNEAVADLEGQLAEKLTIILSLRKKRDMGDISKVFTRKEALDFVSKEKTREVKRLWIGVKDVLKKWLEKILETSRRLSS